MPAAAGHLECRRVPGSVPARGGHGTNPWPSSPKKGDLLPGAEGIPHQHLAGGAEGVKFLVDAEESKGFKRFGVLSMSVGSGSPGMLPLNFKAVLLLGDVWFQCPWMGDFSFVSYLEVAWVTQIHLALLPWIPPVRWGWDKDVSMGVVPLAPGPRESRNPPHPEEDAALQHLPPNPWAFPLPGNSIGAAGKEEGVWV